MTINKLLTRAAKYLKSSTSPQLDAEILLALALRQTRTSILINAKQAIKPINFIYFYWLVWLRKQGWPVAYLTGSKEFYGRKFTVNTHTLIPRPATELLIEKTLEAISANSYIKKVADIGTGSGCIAITLALEAPHLEIFAVDNSASALKMAKQNAHDYKLSNRIHFELGNLLEPLINKNVDVVAANLPYVTNSEYEANTDLKYEPKGALLIQPNLFDNFCQQLAWHKELKYVFLETSPSALESWMNTLTKYYSIKLITILPDLSGSSRLIMIDNTKVRKL